MKAVSLFSGVGGFEIGFERAGIHTILQAERDPWCLKVLRRHWPDTERVTDVRDVTGASLSTLLDSQATYGIPQTAARSDGTPFLVQGMRERVLPGNTQRSQEDARTASTEHLVDEVPDASDGRSNALGPTRWPLRDMPNHLDHSEGRPRPRDGASARAALPPLQPATCGPGRRIVQVEGVGIPGQVDLVYGGFPCQPFSVAGKRLGDADERDGWPEFRRIVGELRPRWVLAENVPGLLSIADGRYFGQILRDLSELGYGVAWGIRDAKFFDVPQRRRRVFIVATRDPGGRAGAERAASVLHICESCGGNPETGRAPGQDAPAAIEGGVGVAENQRGELRLTDTAMSLSAGGGKPGSGYPAVMAVRTAQTSSNGWGVGVDGQAYTLDGAEQAVMVAPALSASGRGTSRTGESRGQDPLVVANPLAANARSGYRDDLDNDTYVPTISTSLGHHGWGIGDQDFETLRPRPSGVRRLTPRECERLMGWPDDWTRWDDQGNEISDSHRYRMCGNGVVATCAEYIGRRLMEVAS